MKDNLSILQSELDNLNTNIIQMTWKISDVEKVVNEEVSKDYQSNIFEMKNRLVDVEGRINEVHDRISHIENRLEEIYAVSHQQIPETNLLSRSLWKRMWAVFGHGVILYALLALVVYALVTQIY